MSATTFRMLSGRVLDLAEPHPELIDIDDIATGLSKVCRFTGQIHEFYSVAQHSCMVARLVQPRLRLPALLHDGTEAYVNDLSRSLKRKPELQGYRDIENRWHHAIEQHFSFILSDADRREIKAADDCAAIWEHVVLRQRHSWWMDGNAAIIDCVRSQWVSSPVDEIRRLAVHVPTVWEPLDCHSARHLFITYFENYKERS